MKFRLTLFALAFLVLAGCQQEASPDDARRRTGVTASAMPETVDDEATLAMLSAYVAAWNSHDADQAGSFLHEDVAYFDASVGETQRGRQAAIDNVIKVFHGAVPDAVWTIRSEPIATDDGVAFEWTISGTNTGDWNPSTKATGQSIQFDGMSFVRIQDGKIAYQGDYYDAATLNRQLGW